MTKLLRSFAIALALVSAASGTSLAASQGTLTLYVNSNAKGGGDGLSPGNALNTIENLDDAARSSYRGQTSIRVTIAPGSYVGQALVWRWSPSGLKSLVIEGNSAASRPKFDGQQKNAWAIFRMPPGKNSNITVRHIFIANYGRAIGFYGEKTGPQNANRNNLIEDNRFEHLGKFESGEKAAYGIIALVDTTDTTIRNNEFADISDTEGCGGLHAIYMAHGSSRNHITGNTFTDVCGDAIKARNDSNDNEIENNTFVRQRGAFFVDSYCDGQRNCAQDECPSFGNWVMGNKGTPLAEGKKIRIVRADDAAGCRRPSAKSRVVE